MKPTAENFELLICDKLGMFSNGSTELLAIELERLSKSLLNGYYNYCMDNYDGNASEEAIEEYLNNQ